MASARPPEAVYYLTPADLVRCHAAALDVAESTARHHMLHRDACSPPSSARVGTHYRKADLIEQAAVLAEGLVASHVWVDGNKRTTWVAVRTPLDVNGLAWVRPPEVGDVVAHLTGLTTRRIRAAGFAAWLRPQQRAAR